MDGGRQAGRQGGTGQWRADAEEVAVDTGAWLLVSCSAPSAASLASRREAAPRLTSPPNEPLEN